ncbi:hypothetical protein HPB50_020382 [Hyalomma asiaticum]|uniref:Uncharacterized protein n=1 Tax=Hyalomma asiaticum TaxID=266040 RepID=A0ACB7SP74_HYAAI|nr:hypothetical protein HPB50_020382 [Hyalomma asiaticum]
MAQLEVGSGQDRSRRGSSAYTPTATAGRPFPPLFESAASSQRDCDAPASAAAFVLPRVLASFISIVFLFFFFIHRRSPLERAASLPFRCPMRQVGWLAAMGHLSARVSDKRKFSGEPECD